MAEIGTPAEYYSHVVPQQFAAALADAPESVDQPELTAIYEIAGEGGGTYALRAAGGAIEVLSDAPPEADMRTTIAIDDWRRGAANDLLDPLVDYVRRHKVAVVKSLKGTVRLELQRSDGSTWQSATTFGGQAEPEVTLRMTADDYAAMMRGDLNGQMAFLTGKLQFEGSLPLLMQVGALSA
jgi:SCP-2 sterol transfer family protein